ncbi:MAG: biopolymer transporter ExbD [Bacteriovoracales bacterium]|nr:biopolymer transporter ExbD [Bacteriovoracales bacterium]
MGLHTQKDRADSDWDGQDDVIGDINLTPLIDIMLVLLIIFMVTSSVSLESGLDIDLPQTAETTESREGNAVIISIDSVGDVFVQGAKVSMETLEQKVAESLKSEGTGLVILEGDKKASLQKAMDIMGVAKKAGAKKFAIAADSVPSP